ncbi:Uncharacterised protein [uncultured Clostridium sp.]|nr:Uncharacterised protein [uncultured Clostridium sp.]
MEIIALSVGYFLGGTVGIGTVISALGLGYFIQLTFKLCKFDGTKVQHRYIVDDINYIRNLLNKENESKQLFIK